MARRAVRVRVICAGAAALAWIILNSLDPGSYLYYRQQDRSQWEHPTGAVALIAFATIVETALAYLVVALDRPRRMWMRALIGLSILVPWGSWISEFIVHAPGFWLLHILWVWLLIVGLGLAVLASAAQHSYTMLRSVRRAGA